MVPPLPPPSPPPFAEPPPPPSTSYRESKRNRREAWYSPAPDFQRLCIQQLDIFRRIVDPDALLSVYVRASCFSVATGFRAAEAVLSNHKVEVIAECKAAVFPMVKHPLWWASWLLNSQDGNAATWRESFSVRAVI
ncbi:hypothetical protein L3X38_005143 [Prunus dulcis]|uniref:Uncharacterized protein n=1 Tax=Prunus dulcis TaxID=3755 RepID=A0AAD4ZQ42_PRUDU|nr:hypothetical protein L3X38_005143 [Prunus dulcis]